MSMEQNTFVTLSLHLIAHNDAHRGSYTMFLSCPEKERYIPIIIGAMEAQTLASLNSENKTERPLMHETSYQMLSANDITVDKVLIHRFLDGIFYSYIYTRSIDNGRISVIDSRTSDAVAMAIITGAPIYTYQDIIDETSIILREVSPIDTSAYKQDNTTDVADIALLKEKMERAVGIEDYEEAARLRDQIKNIETRYKP